MIARPNLRLLATFIGFTASVFAQVDGAGFAAGLRAKYGPPLARETFTARPGIEIVVDYAANGNVCRIQLPPIGPSSEPGVQSAKAIDDFLAELLPSNVRGKELRRWATSTGLHLMSAIEYENLTIAEVSQEQMRTGITVTFTKDQCRDQPTQ
jgi:hypothetical protein